VIRWLQGRTDINGKKLAVWGDALVKPNPRDAKVTVPLDAPNLPRYAEPGGALLAALAGLFEDWVIDSYAIGGCGLDILSRRDFPKSPYVYLPHDAVVPLTAFRIFPPGPVGGGTTNVGEVDTTNRLTRRGDSEELFDTKPADIVKAVMKNLRSP
jgi:hypothetical protein